MSQNPHTDTEITAPNLVLRRPSLTGEIVLNMKYAVWSRPVVKLGTNQVLFHSRARTFTGFSKRGRTFLTDR